MKTIRPLTFLCFSLLGLWASVSTASALVLPEILPLVEGRPFTGENDGRNDQTDLWRNTEIRL
jgi:hypothetical protein